MSILGVLGRFALIYVVLLVIVGLALNYFDISGNSGVNIGILLCTIFWACSSFAKKNGRYFEKNEKAKVVTGFVVINLVIQAAFGAHALAEFGLEVSGSILLVSLGFVGVFTL